MMLPHFHSTVGRRFDAFSEWIVLMRNRHSSASADESSTLIPRNAVERARTDQAAHDPLAALLLQGIPSEIIW